MRLTPAVFRYQLIQRAQQVNKRIVLPEGSEPLTVQAAAICQARGIARCVLLAKPDEVRAVAKAHGFELPDGLEILDPDVIRDRYVEPMVALRVAAWEDIDALTDVQYLLSKPLCLVCDDAELLA